MEKERSSKIRKIDTIVESFHRTMMHYAFWYEEVKHQFGKEKALETMDEVWERYKPIFIKRLYKTLDFELEDGYPKPLLDLRPEKLDDLQKAIGINWLANDGVWFQAVEFKNGMNDAKRCNDSCWAQFSPFEAHRIKKILQMDEFPGIEGLQRALNHRIYADVNKQSFEIAEDGSLIFYMNECRVQMARQRKGLPDYPCKSGGMVEYTTFAQAIDARIKTEVISCPPDKHPAHYFCAWRFFIEK